jgi:hypothetical protein
VRRFGLLPGAWTLVLVLVSVRCHSLAIFVLQHPTHKHARMPFSCFCFECVDTATLGVVERLGSFTRMLSPGLNIVAWPIESVIGRVSGRVQQFACDCATKSKDNVFVWVQARRCVFFFKFLNVAG